MTTEALCDECGEPMADGGPCGWYCTSDKPHPKSDEMTRKLIHDTRNVSGRDHDAIVATLTRERDQLHREVEGLRAALEKIRREADSSSWEEIYAMAQDGLAASGAT